MHILRNTRRLFESAVNFALKPFSALFGAMSFLLVVLLQGLMAAIYIVGINLAAMVVNFLEDIQDGLIDAVLRGVVLLSFFFITAIVFTGLFLFYGTKAIVVGLERGWREGFSFGVAKIADRIRLGFRFGYLNHVDDPTDFPIITLISLMLEGNGWEEFFAYCEVFFNNQGTLNTGARRISPEQFEAMHISQTEFAQLLTKHTRLSQNEIKKLETLSDHDIQKKLDTYNRRQAILEETGACPIMYDRESAILVFQEVFQANQWVGDPNDVPTIYNKEALKKWVYETKAECPHNRSEMRMGTEGVKRTRYHNLYAQRNGEQIVVSDELTKLAVELKACLLQTNPKPLNEKLKQETSIASFSYAASQITSFPTTTILSSDRDHEADPQSSTANCHSNCDLRGHCKRLTPFM